MHFRKKNVYSLSFGQWNIKYVASYVCLHIISHRREHKIRWEKFNNPQKWGCCSICFYADGIYWERNENFPAQLYSKGASRTRRERSSQVGWKPKRIEISIFPSIYIYILSALFVKDDDRRENTVADTKRVFWRNPYFWGGGGEREHDGFSLSPNWFHIYDCREAHELTVCCWSIRWDSNQTYAGKTSQVRVCVYLCVCVCD